MLIFKPDGYRFHKNQTLTVLDSINGNKVSKQQCHLDDNDDFHSSFVRLDGLWVQFFMRSINFRGN
jgi:hypothetical protein